MEDLNGILDILKVCLWLGVIIVCVALVVSGILRWLAPPEKRSRRLNISGWLAFTMLIIMILYGWRADILHLFTNSGGSQAMTSIAVNSTKMAVKLLLLGAVFAIAAIVLLVFIVLLIKGIRVVLCAQNRTVKDWAKALKELGEQFSVITKTPIFTFFVTCGVLSVFIILPLLLGNPEGETGMAETWVDGVQTFASAISRNESTAKNADADTDDNANPKEDENPIEDTDPDRGINLTRNTAKAKDIPIPEAVITYILVYVIVLGVGFSIARILYTIVKDNLKQKQTINLFDEYSGSMGVLGVGVSILLVLQDDELNIYQDELLKILAGFFKYFTIVAIVMALAIVILEVIRLVMDMRETLIRKEARYLFVALVGRVSLLTLMLLNSISSALSSAIGQHDDVDISQTQRKLIRHITEAMDQEIDGGIEDNKDATFASFKESVTKK